jgi:microcystin-dependent protein
MAIEILENTLLKLLVRRGTDYDRTNITLDSGELGYTTDTERLYIGNSTTKGGIVVGNKYKGSHATVTSLAPVVTGDYVFDTNSNELKICVAGNGSNDADWLAVSRSLSAGDGTIVFNDVGDGIQVGILSAGNFHANALGNSIELDGSSRIALSSTINIDAITQRTATEGSYLQLPSTLKINTIDYDFPSTSPGQNTYLGRGLGADEGTLSWSVPSIVESTVAPTTATTIPVGTIVPFASAAVDVPYGWLGCDGSEYASTEYPDLSAVIGIAYNTGGESTASNHFRVPNLQSKAVFGSNNPVNSTLMAVTTGSHTSPGLSATGMNFIIKSVGGVTNPTLTIKKNLSAFVINPAGTKTVDKTGASFDPLSGSVIIERPAPGMVIYDDGSTHDFTVPDGIHYLKYIVTGSGTKGASTPGGAGSTCIGYLSAYPGTQFRIVVGLGFSKADGMADGRPSEIYHLDGSTTTLLVRADGGIAESLVAGNPADRDERNDDGTPPGIAAGTIDLDSNYILNGFIVKGGSGLTDTDYSGGHEESLGASSFFGNAPAPGGGQASHASVGIGPTPSNGVVILEWT